MQPDKIFLTVNGREISLADLLAMNRDEVRTVYARGCTFDKADPDFRYLCAGCDMRGYLFEAMHVRGQWRILAGYRNYSLTEARTHWGPGGDSDRADCLALVEKLAAMIEGASDV